MDIPPPLRPEPTSDRRYLRRTTPFQSLNFDAFAIILFLAISLCFIFFLILISPFHSFSFHFFKPQSPWKSLDFLSLALVLFAIACGLLSNNNGGNTFHEEIYRTAFTLKDLEQTHKSNPSTPNQWNGYSDRTDQILLHHPPELAGVEHWKLSSGSNYMVNYQSISSDSLQHCPNLKDFNDGFVSKSASSATFPVYNEETPSSFSPLHQLSVQPLMTEPPQPSSPPGRLPLPFSVVETERNNKEDENLEHEPLVLDFPALEGEISENEKQREIESKETKRIKNKTKKKKMKKWQKGVENFKEFLTPQHRYYNRPLSLPPVPPPAVAVHHFQTSSLIGEKKRDFPAPPESPPQKLIAVGTQNSNGGKPPSTAAELQITKKEESKSNENGERKGTKFCESPDVNSEADSFIERFREGLKLERMNSMKEKQRKTTTSILGRKGP